jgi:hypothetical protein
MKFNKGDKVVFIQHKSRVFDLPSNDRKCFSLSQTYTIDTIACSRDKTYTVKEVNNSYIFENQVRLKILQ